MTTPTQDPNQAKDHPYHREQPKEDSGAGMPHAGKTVGAKPHEGVDTSFEPEEDPEAT
jgi:hypothetical protein